MRLNRGGHDPFKVYAAYHAAVNHNGEPTVILAKTVKGYGMGEGGESENTTHQVKKLDLDDLKHFRDRFDVPLTDDDLEKVPYYRPAPDTPEMVYLRRNREQLGGFIPRRVVVENDIKVPVAPCFESQLKGTGDREISYHDGVRPDAADAGARQDDRSSASCRSCPTKRARSAWKGCSVSSASTRPKDSSTNPKTPARSPRYRESKDGQVLEEGINEAGAFSAWIAAATVYEFASLYAGAVLHLLLDVRLPAHRRSSRGQPATCRREGFCSAVPPAARR